MDLSSKKKCKPKNHACSYCPLRCASKFVLENHIRCKHDISITQCKFLCGYFSKSSQQMRKHVRECHESKPLHSCSLCNFTSLSAYGIKVHAKNVHGEKNFRCPQCPARFGLVGHRKWHIQRTHFTAKNFYCDFCDFSCRRADEKSVHEEKRHRWIFLIFLPVTFIEILFCKWSP